MAEFYLDKHRFEEERRQDAMRSTVPTPHTAALDVAAVCHTAVAQ